MDPHKLDLFLDFITSSHIIKDLPFGERKLRLSNGKVVETPNVIRCMAPAAIIQQFKQYCVENDEVSLGESTMFKILAECSAIVRKAFEGIDYYVAEGRRAFQDICSVVEELCQVGALTNDKMKEYIDVAQECKRYLKVDYKVHITETSSVPDHCRKFALTDKLGTFACKCEHEHDMVCVNCEQIHELLSSLTNLILESDLKEKEENRDDYQYKLTQAQSNINNWKTHIIRTSHQEKAKSEIMANMGPHDVLLVLDWAMKYLPRRYREDQSNWFAKRGVSWHIGVAFRRRETVESLAFIHIFNGQISQDSNATSAVILDIIKELKERIECVEKVHLWSDNAGCYKSSETISALFYSRSVHSYDFCEAQSGKGACDRTAATIKSGIRRYVNQGNDVMTAKQMKSAIEETSKKVHYAVKVVEVDSSSAKTKVQIPSISAMNNFQFEESGVRVWKHYKLGPGKIIPYSENTTVVQPSLSVLEKPKEMVDFHALVQSATVPSEMQQNEGIFTCSNDGCTSSFNTHRELQDHAILDECNVQSEKIKKCDIMKTQYIKKLSEAQITSKHVTMTGNCSEIQRTQTMDQGWGIKSERKNKRFNDKQKNFLIERFNIGVQTGRKEDPENVAILMRNIKNADGSRRFSLSEFLTSQQITSFFSRHYRKNEALREQTISDIENTLLN